MSDHDEREWLLSLLDVHGQQFLSSFDLPPALKKKIGNIREPIDASPSTSRSAEEWNGFGESNSREEEPSSNELDEGSTINHEIFFASHE